ncbi:MAG: HEAT repeat domain-containing protein, partial [Candidatus Binatia bacterium]
DEAIADLVSSPDADSRLAIASTMGELPPRVMLPVAQALLADATPQIRRLVAKALGTGPDVERIPLLLELLAFPECREAARAGLVALGTPAIEQLAAALAAVQTPASIRRHLPRTISRFRSPTAAIVLLEQLGRENDGRVSYKLLRGLGHLSADDPTLPVDSAVLVAEAESNLQRAQQLLAYRVGHDLVRERSGGNAEYHELLAELLAEKEGRALEKVFRVLQVLETSEEYATIFSALSAEDPLVRAGARELLDNVLEGRFGDGLLALTDSAPPLERLRGTIRVLPLPLAETVMAAASWTPAAGEDKDPALAVLDALASDRSAALAALARRLRASLLVGGDPRGEPEDRRAVV